MGADSPHFVWNPDPVLIDLGLLQVRWYGLLFALGFLAGFIVMRGIFRREDKPERDLDFLLGYMAVGTIVGARLGHILFYHPGYYLTHPVEIIKVWEGGLASHGGVLGILAALWLYTRRRPEQPYLWLLDRMALPAVLAGSFIRVGNFFNAEILGIPADVPWAVVFLRYDRVPRHPAQLYEAIAYLLLFVVLYGLYRKAGPDLPRGLLLGAMLVGVFTARFLIEFVKMQQAFYATGWPLSVGQLLSLPFVAAGLSLLGYALWNRSRSVRT